MSSVRVFVQGVHDAELFGLVGPWLSSKAVHKALGAPATSEDGDMWLVAVNDEAEGFAIAKPNGESVHISNVYSESPAARMSLLREALRLIGESVGRVFTFGRPDDPIWAEQGFTFKKHARGEFGTWEKLMTEKK